MSQFRENLRTDGRSDGLTLLLRSLPAEAGGPTKNKILAEIHILDNEKACQESNILVKIIKDNIDNFSEFIFHNINNSIFDATFPSELKNADVIYSF